MTIPPDFDLDLSLPDTPLVASTLAFVDATHSSLISNHCLRTYLFARALAAGRDYDSEMVFLICALHDVGLTEEGAGSQRFEVDGADRAAAFLAEHGASDAQIDTVWDGVALHTSPSLVTSPVYARRRPAEIRIAQAGIAYDVLGRSFELISAPEKVPPAYAEQIHSAYPRLGGSPALTELITSQAVADPRKAPPWTLPGDLAHRRDPDAPHVTWDLLLQHNGWDHA